jgi:hypothetical protein
MKERKSVLIAVFIALPVFFSFTFFTGNKTISLKVETMKLNKGQYIKSEADIYYHLNSGRMVKSFTYPMKFIQFTNNHGETKIYTPKDNTVLMTQNVVFSTYGDVLYYFFNGKTDDFGLTIGKFTQKDVVFKDDLMINVWSPPAQLANDMLKIEIAYKGYDPVFIGYYKKDGFIAKKIFFSNFSKVGSTNFPLRITEIDYKSETDSVVTRSVFSKIQYNSPESDIFLNYKIPENAKVLNP